MYHRISHPDPAIDGQMIAPERMDRLALEDARNDPCLSAVEEAEISMVHGAGWDSL